MLQIDIGITDEDNIPTKDNKHYFLKWGMGNCVEKLNGLTTTVRDQKYFYKMIWADNAIDN